MQPPDTEPSNSPLAAIAICPPTGTGAEPQVSTTVAIATRPSRAIQSRAEPRMSCERAGRMLSAWSVMVF